MFKKKILKSGLRFISVPQKRGTQAIAILLLVGTGSKYEKKEESGISHFVEHMFFKGTKKHPSSLALAEVLDEVGGLYNAFTSQDYTGYWAKTSYQNFDLALDWISEIFFDSLFSPEQIEKEKRVISEEINMIHDDPMRLVAYLWQKVLYGDQPAGREIIGTKKSINQMNREKILSYIKKQYTARNTIICFSGKFDEEKAINKAEKLFKKISSKAPCPKQPVKEKQIKPQLIFKNKKTEQSHFCLGFRGYNLFHPQKYSQKVLSVILGGMMSSRLFNKIREEMGAAYYIYTTASSDPETGFISTQAGVDNSRLEEVVRAVLEEYQRIAKEKVSSKEVRKAKEYLKGRLALALESSDEKATFYGIQELLELKTSSPKEIFKKIDRVEPQMVLKTAENLFKKQGLNLALISPCKEGAAFNKILNDY